MQEKRAQAVRVERSRRQVVAGTYETLERISGAVDRLQASLQAQCNKLVDADAVLSEIRCDLLRCFATKGYRDQRAINELTEATHG